MIPTRGRRKWQIIPALLVAGLIGLFLLISRKDGTRNKIAPNLAELRGEPINSSAIATNADTPSAPAPSSRRKRPKPDSFQKRLVQFHASQAGKTNAEEDQAFQPLGTPSQLIARMPDEIPDALIKGYNRVGFPELAGFTFNVTDEIADAAKYPAVASAKTRAQIPPSVQALDGSKIAIRGFLVPLRMLEGRTVEFLLMRDQNLCCFGKVPNLNEWISVQATNLSVKPDMDVPLTVCGKLQVREQRENGYLVGLYHIDADKVFTPK